MLSPPPIRRNREGLAGDRLVSGWPLLPSSGSRSFGGCNSNGRSIRNTATATRSRFSAPTCFGGAGKPRPLPRHPGPRVLDRRSLFLAAAVSRPDPSDPGSESGLAPAQLGDGRFARRSSPPRAFAWPAGLRWVRHFAFPILFFFVAVPWPTSLEQMVIQGLMRADALINVEVPHRDRHPSRADGQRHRSRLRFCRDR